MWRTKARARGTRARANSEVRKGRTIKGTTALVVIALLMPGLAEAAGTGDPAKGKLLFDKHCMVCHGPQGKGDGPTGRALIPPATDFTSQPSRKKSGADLRRVIEQGSPGTAMPAWKGPLSEMQLADVAAYVETLRK